MMGCGSTKGTRPGTAIHLNNNNIIQKGPLDRRRMPHMNNFDLQDADEGIVKLSKGSYQGGSLTAATLERFLDVEREVQFFEKRHVLETYQVKTEQLEQLELAIEQLEEAQHDLDQFIEALAAKYVLAYVRMNLQQTLTDGQRIPLKQFILERTEDGGILNKDEEELVDSLNRQEILQRELESTVGQRDRLRKEVVYLGLEGEKLQHIYQQRDELLDSVFGGEYGSELENELERELDVLQERKQHVDQAFYKWKQAQTMLKQAASQLGLAVQKWKRVATIPENDIEKRFHYAAEARNNLVAASQNVQGAHRYLPAVAFPYCTPEELETLEKAVTFIFTDMQTPERYEHAHGCYHTTYRRAGALRQWFEQVMNSTIARDLSELGDQVKEKASELRLERVKLIRGRIKEATGAEPEVRSDTRLDSELDDVLADEQVAQVFEADRIRGKAGMLLTPESRMGSIPLPTPLPMSDLAPMPSTEEIFGKMDEIRREHMSQLDGYKTLQAFTQARMAQGLQEKLQARRSRRDTRNAHEREVAAMTPAI